MQQPARDIYISVFPTQYLVFFFWCERKVKDVHNWNNDAHRAAKGIEDVADSEENDVRRDKVLVTSIPSGNAII